MSIVFFPPDKVKFLVVKEISKKRKYKSKLCDTFLSQSSFSNTKYKNFLIIHHTIIVFSELTRIILILVTRPQSMKVFLKSYSNEELNKRQM